MDTVIVNRIEKHSKLAASSGATLINRSSTPPKVQFVPAHINIWAPQAQQHLLKQHGSKSSRPQSAQGTVHKGLPITAVSLQSAINFKNETKTIGNNSGRPTSAPVLTFSRSRITSDQPLHNPHVEEAVNTSGPVFTARTILDHQLPQSTSEHSKTQRPITSDLRGLQSSSLAQHSQKRPKSCQVPDRTARVFVRASQQKYAEIETFDSGGDSDTETFAHTKLANASSRPSSSIPKHSEHSKLHRTDFGLVFLCSAPFWIGIYLTPSQHATLCQ
jgi:hypothetical protein